MNDARFASRNIENVIRLVDENPLAWISLQDSGGPFATAAPVRPAVVDGQLAVLVGHVPRTSRIARCLEFPCSALVLVLGPHAYISPSWMSERTQAPTWNYTSAQFVTEIELVDDPTFLEQHLRDLTASQERGRKGTWRIDEMGDRMHELAARIIAFEARIVSTQCRFKLGQDESGRTYAEIVRHLEQAGVRSLVEWMRSFSPDS